MTVDALAELMHRADLGELDVWGMSELADAWARADGFGRPPSSMYYAATRAAMYYEAVRTAFAEFCDSRSVMPWGLDLGLDGWRPIAEAALAALAARALAADAQG